MIKLVKITGQSLYPIYREGDFVVVSKIPFLFGPVRPGDVIVFRHPIYGLMIKKVERCVPQTGDVYVVGMHGHSIDSRRFGAIRRDDIVGKVIWHLKKR
ncbi:MAG: S26 family signal peptidase [Acidobacteria bacterium]|nr:MAG: S26 family signal peptidase [Acidobacteriota bacterium]